MRGGETLFEAALGKDCVHGTFFAPRLFEIANLDAVCDAVNRTGYGLTLGIHSRIDTAAEFVSERVLVGNLYANSDMIGAVVGVQPFGGEGLSGTGSKAGEGGLIGQAARQPQHVLDGVLLSGVRINA